MADRSSSFEAVVLRVRESPAGDRIVSLLCDEDGVLDAFAFGGPKSKLRSLAAPWHAGRAWVYRDSARGLTKLTDFDAQYDFAAIRESLSTIGAASLAGELIMATSALGGDGADARALFMDLLAALCSSPNGDPGLTAARDDAARAARSDRALTQFCLRAVSLMGVMPDPAECGSCAGQIFPDTVHSYSRRAGAFLCRRCAGEEHVSGALVAIPPGALAWLAATLSQPFGTAMRSGLSDGALSAIKACALDLAGKAAHGRLKTLDSGLV
ncbi:MAG: hypothetical protein E4H20_03250 [Spirochaetales bacterium]|nr:MAG: hypothetical protein E4H20_03250 [Spirochaetales bacterium]